MKMDVPAMHMLHNVFSGPCGTASVERLFSVMGADHFMHDTLDCSGRSRHLVSLGVRYELEKKIGEGSFGVVRLCKELSTGKVI